MTEKRPIDVVIAGHVCLDIIPGFPAGQTYHRDDVFTPGKLVEVEDAAVSTGGPVSNTGIGLAKLGMKVSFIAKTGDDQFGHTTRELLSKWAGVEGLSVSGEEPSSYTLVIAPPGIDRIFFHAPGTNHTFGADNVDYALVSQARLFHLGYPPLMRRLFRNGGAQLVELFRRAREQGATTSLDMALPDPKSEAGMTDWLAIFRDLLPHVDIFHPSVEEGLFMAQREKWTRLKAQAGPGGDILDQLCGDDYTELSGLLLAMGPAMVTLKSGHRGFYLRTADAARLEKMGAACVPDIAAWANREIWAPAYVVPKIASAAGSGDSSLAGFTTALLRGEGPERCVESGNAVGYQNLHALDAVSGIRDWPATLEIIADLAHPRHPINTGANWRRDDANHIAFGPKDSQV